MAASHGWSDPSQCPFCGETIPSPGSGFVSHIDENPDCNDEFETWREMVTDDIRGGWTG